jgi:transketolase
MRNKFIELLTERGKIDNNIILIVGDLGYSVVEEFQRQLPNQFFNAGIAEQSMAGMAAGLASEAKHVFTYSIGNFPTFRAAEQLRNDVDYHNLPVTTVIVGGGVSYGALGYSHHAFQDYGLIRLFPNHLILSPGDPVEVKAVMEFIIKNPQPSYLRLGKAGEREFHQNEIDVLPGKFIKVKESNSQRNILTTGSALQRAEELFPDCNIYSIPIWGMSCKSAVAIELSQFSKLEILEDHLLDGGLFSYLSEIAAMAELKVNLKPWAFNHEIIGRVAGQRELENIGWGLSKN